VGWADYDVISGPAGVGRLLLDAVDTRSVRDPDAQGLPVARSALTAVLEHLVRLTRPVVVGGAPVPGWWVPGWWVPADRQPEAERSHYPYGHLNLGMAHGVTGPLALLSLAAQRRYMVPGQADAIRTIARWLCGWATAGRTGSDWPAMVGVDAEPRTGHPTARSGWCYGAPGVASALYRAGDALGEHDWRDTALRALHALLARDEAAWRLTGPGMCHGYAGLMAILHRIGSVAGDPVLTAGAVRLAERLLNHADERAPFVFADRVPGPDPGAAPVHVDVPGLLDGAAGVACALLDLVPSELLATSRQPAPDGRRSTERPWASVFLLE
jgi:hypothetical protein